jgi:uncharacterized protein (DUF983 family)
MNLTKKLIIISVIAVLFSVFIFSFIDALFKQPEYSDFCKTNYRPDLIPKAINESCKDKAPNTTLRDECFDKQGQFQAIYENGCIVDFKCETCNLEYENAKSKHDFFAFIIASIMGVIVVLTAIYMPYKKNSLKEFVLTGLMIGGFIGIFVSTGNYFSDMHRIIKPIVILMEIIFVIFVAHKKFVK